VPSLMGGHPDTLGTPLLPLRPPFFSVATKRKASFIFVRDHRSCPYAVALQLNPPFFPDIGKSQVLPPFRRAAAPPPLLRNKEKSRVLKDFLIFGNPAILLAVFRVRQPGCLNKTRGFAPTSQSGSQKFGTPPDRSEFAFIGFSLCVNDTII